MTRGDLVNRVSAKIGLEKTAGSEELSLMQDWADEGVVDVLLQTHIFTQIGDMDLTAGTANYRLDHAVLAIDDGRGSTPAGIGPYIVIPLSEMIALQSAAVVTQGFRKFLSIEGDLLVVHPTPEADEELRFFYIPRPTPMTLDAHDPSEEAYGGIPTEHHRAIEYFMLWQAAEYDDKAAVLRPQEYRQAYLAECAEIRKRKRKMRGRSLLPGRVGYPSARRVPLRNDVYPGG